MGSMTEDLQAIIQQVMAGSRNETDLKAIADAVASERLVLANALGAVGVGGDVTASQIVPGSGNVLGDGNIVFQINSTTVQKLQAIPELSAVLSQYFGLGQSEANASTDELVQQVRQKIRTDVQERCGMMRVLDMTQPIGLSDIYTDVNILEKITGKRRLNLSELMQDFDPESESFDRYGLCNISEKRVLGIDAVKQHPKLMVLGKPGAGKTTFLKYLAVQCITGSFQVERIPVFITLKQFSEDTCKPDLLTFICNFLAKSDISISCVRHLLKSGKFLILFDGLDEVSEENSSRVINQIHEFTRTFFLSDLFQKEVDEFVEKIVSKLKAISRASLNKKSKLKYIDWLKKEFSGCHKLIDKVEAILEESLTQIERGILKVEVSTKDYEKFVQSFLSEVNKISYLDYLNFFVKQKPTNTYNNYFIVTCRIAAREEKFEQFTEVEVADFDDRQIKIFVDKWFREREPNPSQAFIEQIELTHTIKELATSPLLLTLLCLVFQENFDFPSNRSELYKEGINILLKKWDAERLIKRDTVYKKLSSSRKEDLLSHIAFTAFERKEYFFKQINIEGYISDYIRNLPDAQTDPETLQLDSEAVLRSVEAQHGLLVERARGIYSFSHLTFQEYFTARKIITTTNPQFLESGLQCLANHIVEKRWREVLLLALGMLSDASRLLELMKQKVDSILAKDENLQEFLSWIIKKSLSVRSTYKLPAIRAFYFAHVYEITFSNITKDSKNSIESKLPFSIDSSFDERLTNEAHELAFRLHEARRRVFAHRKDPEFVLVIAFAKTEAFDLLTMPESSCKLKQLQKQIPVSGEKKSFESWWLANSRVWILQFKSVLEEDLDIGYDWSFDANQLELLKQYYDANLLLVDCLNSDCYISREVREKIEETLLLPVTELKNVKREKRGKKN